MSEFAKSIQIYCQAKDVIVDSEKIKIDFEIPSELPQNLNFILWTPNAKCWYDTDMNKFELEPTQENYDKWLKPFVDLWEVEWSKVSPSRIQKQLTDAVQYVLDTKAQELNYDSCLSVCSYVDTGVSKFDDEGRAFRSWRSAVWKKGYEILAEVQAGTRSIPTESELLAMLPELEISYS